MNGSANARVSDPATSHEAAESVDVGAGTAAVLRVLRGGPATDDYGYALARRFAPISPSGYRSRRAELVRSGDVVDTGTKNTLPTGRKAIVWGLA